MLPVCDVLCWNPPTWFPWKALGGQFQHDINYIIWPHDPPVHSHGKTWAESYAAFVSPTFPPQPQTKETDSWLSLGSTLTQLQQFPIWFHRESLFSSCKVATIFLDSPTTESHFAGETAHSALKQRDTNTHQHGWTALEHFSQASCEQEMKMKTATWSGLSPWLPMVSPNHPKSNGLSNVSRRLAFCGMFHGTN